METTGRDPADDARAREWSREARRRAEADEVHDDSAWLAEERDRVGARMETIRGFVWDAILPVLAEHQDRPIRVLHYACNVGGTTEAIAERLAFVTGGRCNVLGIDPSPENIGIALRAMYATPINERPPVSYMAGETGALARGTFHAIFSTHHVDHADQAVLREFVRLLARPGVVCLPFAEPERGAMANRLLVDFCDVTISDDPVTGDRARWATAVIR